MQVYPVLLAAVQRAYREIANDKLCFQEVSGYGSSHNALLPLHLPFNNLF